MAAVVGSIGMLLIPIALIMFVIGLFKKSPNLKSKALKCFGLGLVLFIVGGIFHDSTPKDKNEAKLQATNQVTKQEEKKDVVPKAEVKQEEKKETKQETKEKPESEPQKGVKPEEKQISYNLEKLLPLAKQNRLTEEQTREFGRIMLSSGINPDNIVDYDFTFSGQATIFYSVPKEYLTCVEHPDSYDRVIIEMRYDYGTKKVKEISGLGATFFKNGQVFHQLKDLFPGEDSIYPEKAFKAVNDAVLISRIFTDPDNKKEIVNGLQKPKMTRSEFYDNNTKFMSEWKTPKFKAERKYYGGKDEFWYEIIVQLDENGNPTNRGTRIMDVTKARNEVEVF